MFAVIEIHKNQYKVQEGDELLLGRMVDKQKGDKFKADQVLLLAEEDGSDVKIGMPALNAEVDLEVLGDEKGDKIRVFKMKAKTRYRLTKGFRAKYTRVKVLKIGKVVVKHS